MDATNWIVSWPNSDIPMASLFVVFQFASFWIQDTEAQHFLPDSKISPRVNRPSPFVKWDPRIHDLTTPADPVNVSWASVLGGRYKQEAVRIVALVCGLTRVCNSTGMDIAEYPIRQDCSPCDFCRCDDVCVTYGDCCIDKALDDVIGDVVIKDTPNLLEEFSSSGCFDTGVRARDHRERKDMAKYKLVSFCPKDYTQNRDVIENCLNGSTELDGPEIRTDSMWNIWPVTSKTTSVSYRNLACAECHEDHVDAMYWNLKITCPLESTIPQGYTKTQVLQQVLNRVDCGMVFNIPEGFELRECKRDSFGNPGVKECNQTGVRSVVDPVLWKMCHTFPTTTQHGFSQVYANVFCILCQEDMTRKWQSACRTVQGSFGFFYMISPSAIRRVTSSEGHAERACDCDGDDEALDPVSNTCRQLLCPQGYNLLRNNTEVQCVDDHTQANGLPYFLNIELTSVNASITYKDVADNTAFHFLSLAIKARLTTELKLIQLNLNADIQQFTTYLYPPSCHPNHDQRSANSVNIGLSAKIVITKNTRVSSMAHTFKSFLDFEWNMAVFLPDKGIATVLFVSQFTPSLNKATLDFLTRQKDTVTKFPIPDCTQFGVGLNFRESSRSEVKEYKEVKHSLTCPYFLLDENFQDYFTTDVDVGGQNPLLNERLVLRYNTTSAGSVDLNISMLDFHTTTLKNGVNSTIVCAEGILKYWTEYADRRKNENVKNGVNFGRGLELTSIICLSVSCVCLFITLVTYALFPSLRTLPGKNTMALVTTMLLTMVMCLVTPFFETRTVTCQIVGVVNHFSLLSSVTWMVICTYRMYKIFTKIFNHSHGQGKNKKEIRCFVKYLSVSIIIPATIIAINMISNYATHSNYNNNHNKEDSSKSSEMQSKNTSTTLKESKTNQPIKTQNSVSCDKDEPSLTPIGYGDGVCYISNELSVLLAAAGPIIVAVMTNCVFFCLTLQSMRQMTADQKTVRREPRQQMVIYVKLCALTGLNWLPGLLSVFVDSEIIWYTFLILAGLQGLYVLVAFVCNARIMALYQTKFCGRKPARETAKAQGTKETSLTNQTGSSNSGNNRKKKEYELSNTTKSDDVTENDDVATHPIATRENDVGEVESVKI